MMNVTESTGFATLIVTIITSVFFPFVQRPALNYQVDDEPANGLAMNRYKIELLNYGPLTAHNVFVSLRTSGGNVTLFSSEPYLSTVYSQDNATGSRDTAFAKIGVLPSFGSITIHAVVDGPIQPATDLLYVYVSSDESIGRVTEHTIAIISAISTFVIGSSVAVIWLWKKFIYPRAPLPDPKPQTYREKIVAFGRTRRHR